MLVYPPSENKLCHLRKDKEQLRRKEEQLREEKREKEGDLREEKKQLLLKRFDGGKYNGTICSVHKQSNCACIVPDDGECTSAQSSALTREESTQSTGKIMKV